MSSSPSGMKPSDDIFTLGVPVLRATLCYYLIWKFKRKSSAQTVGIEEGMDKAVKGGFSYIYNYYYIRIMTDTQYTDGMGYTPIYFSKTMYPLFAGNAWAFR